MGDSAHVDSFDALKQFKNALRKFAEACSVALGDAESETHRMTNWLELEQSSYWSAQVRKRTELVSRCKDAVRQKKLFKDATGRQQSAVDEEKALKIAERALAEAQQKLVNVKRWSRALPREIELYKGSVQRFATTIHVDVPSAIHRLDRMIGSLEKYASLAAPASAASTAASTSGASSSAIPADAGETMARSEPGEVVAGDVGGPKPDAGPEGRKE